MIKNMIKEEFIDNVDNFDTTTIDYPILLVQVRKEDSTFRDIPIVKGFVGSYIDYDDDTTIAVDETSVKSTSKNLCGYVQIDGDNSFVLPDKEYKNSEFIDYPEDYSFNSLDYFTILIKKNNSIQSLRMYQRCSFLVPKTKVETKSTSNITITPTTSGLEISCEEDTSIYVLGVYIS